MKYQLLLLTLFAVTGCFSCKEGKKKGLALNGVQTIKIGDMDLTSRMIKMEDKTMVANSSDGILYFNVRIDPPVDAEFEKGKKLYLDYDMQNDFVLSVGVDSIPAIFCQRIENGRRNCYEYIVAFDTGLNAETDYFTLVYNDKIFSVGSVAFAYSHSEIKN